MAGCGTAPRGRRCTVSGLGRSGSSIRTPSWRSSFRGIDTLSALIIVLEVADFTRFPRAVQLGSWLGLVPSREQSGESDVHGSITKTGSKYARRILVEAAWHYARPPGLGRTLSERQEGLPDHVLQIASRAHSRLYRVHKRMRQRKKPGNVITVACARTRLLPLGRRHRSINQTNSPLPLGWGGAGPRSPLARAVLLWAALTRPRPLLDTRSASDETRDLGCQSPHMRLTDVENFARRLPTRAHFHQPLNGNNEGSMNAAHLTDGPPYE